MLENGDALYLLFEYFKIKIVNLFLYVPLSWIKDGVARVWTDHKKCWNAAH